MLQALQENLFWALATVCAQIPKLSTSVSHDDPSKEWRQRVQAADVLVRGDVGAVLLDRRAASVIRRPVVEILCDLGDHMGFRRSCGVQADDVKWEHVPAIREAIFEEVVCTLKYERELAAGAVE